MGYPNYSKQNSPERVVTDLGIMAAGTVLLDKRVFLRDATDLMHMLNKSQARMLIVDPGEKPQAGGPSAWDIIRY
nr:hypothetical protein BaRGS_029867 [Batillaria attramentaria]